MTTDRETLENLSRTDCMNLLDATTIGRLAVSMAALPVIWPVNFALVDGNIVIATTPGTSLEAATVNAVVAFEADGFDPVDHGRWSVLVQGVAVAVTNPDEIRRLEATARPPGSRTNGHFVRIDTRILSGRRLIDSAVRSLP